MRSMILFYAWLTWSFTLEFFSPFFVETIFHWLIGLLETETYFPEFEILTAAAEDWGLLACHAVLVDEQFTVFWGP